MFSFRNWDIQSNYITIFNRTINIKVLNRPPVPLIPILAPFYNNSFIKLSEDFLSSSRKYMLTLIDQKSSWKLWCQRFYIHFCLFLYHFAVILMTRISECTNTRDLGLSYIKKNEWRRLWQLLSSASCALPSMCRALQWGRWPVLLFLPHGTQHWFRPH